MSKGGENISVYITKNKRRIIRNRYNNSGFGLEILKLMRIYEEINEEFGEYRKQQREMKGEHERFEQSIRRTRTNIQAILEANLDSKSYFLTLTFREEINDYNKANQKFNYWVRLKNKDVKYIAIKELQRQNRNDVIHYHLIVFDCENIEELAKSWTYGFYYIKQISNRYSYSISNYMTKYFSKDKNQLVHNKKKIFSKSRNLKKPLYISDYALSQIYKLAGINIDLMTFDFSQYNYITKEYSNKVVALEIKDENEHYKILRQMFGKDIKITFEV